MKSWFNKKADAVLSNETIEQVVLWTVFLLIVLGAAFFIYTKIYK